MNQNSFFIGPFLFIFQDIPEGETMTGARSLQFLEKTQVFTVQSWASKQSLPLRHSRQCNKALVTRKIQKKIKPHCRYLSAQRK